MATVMDINIFRVYVSDNPSVRKKNYYFIIFYSKVWVKSNSIVLEL